MEKYTNATIKTPTQTIKTAEALDVGGNYYFVENNELFCVRKGEGVSISYEAQAPDSDSSNYVNKKETVIA